MRILPMRATPPYLFVTILFELIILSGCATPGLMKRWEREDQLPLESQHFAVYLDEGIDRAVGTEVLQALEFSRDRVGLALNYYCDDKVVCNLYRNEQHLRNICVGLPLGFFVPRKTPLAYVLGGEVHGRLFTTPGGSVSKLWASTFTHEYCHVMFKKVTGRHYFQYSWLQEGLGEYFRQLYLQEKVLPPELNESGDETFLVTKDANSALDNPKIHVRDKTHGIWSYSDWEVRDALRYDTLPSSSELCPRTFIGYWNKFNTQRANQVYAISSSLVEFLVDEFGWNKMRQLLNGLSQDSDLDRVMLQVYGFDQERLDLKWRWHLKERWPDPWQPNIAMVYLVRGNWEIDGLESGIRTALADRNIEAARCHRMYLESRRIPPPADPSLAPLVPPQNRYGSDPRLVDPAEDFEGDRSRRAIVPLQRTAKAPAVEQYEAAMACYSTGQFAEGVEHLRAALEAEPEQMTSLRIHLARGLWLTGEKEEAIQLYREELKVAEEPPFFNEVAWCLECVGQRAEAIRLYQWIVDTSDVQGLVDHARRRIDRIKNGDKVHPEEAIPRRVAMSTTLQTN